jgi:hypothetical protein
MFELLLSVASLTTISNKSGGTNSLLLVVPLSFQQNSNNSVSLFTQNNCCKNHGRSCHQVTLCCSLHFESLQEFGRQHQKMAARRVNVLFSI